MEKCRRNQHKNDGEDNTLNLMKTGNFRGVFMKGCKYIYGKVCRVTISTKINKIKLRMPSKLDENRKLRGIPMNG